MMAMQHKCFTIQTVFLKLYNRITFSIQNHELKNGKKKDRKMRSFLLSKILFIKNTTKATYKFNINIIMRFANFTLVSHSGFYEIKIKNWLTRATQLHKNCASRHPIFCFENRDLSISIQVICLKSERWADIESCCF